MSWACNPSAVRVRWPSASSTVTWRHTVRLSSTRDPASRIPLSAFSTMDTWNGGAVDVNTLGATWGALTWGHWCGNPTGPTWGTDTPGWGIAASAAAAWFAYVSCPGIICGGGRASGAASTADGDIAVLGAGAMKGAAAATAAAAAAASAAALLGAAAAAGAGAATGRTAAGGSAWVGLAAMSWPVLEITKAGAAVVGAPARAIIGGADITCTAVPPCLAGGWVPTCCTWSEDVTGASNGTVGCDGGGPSAGGCDGSMNLVTPTARAWREGEWVVSIGRLASRGPSSFQSCASCFVRCPES